MRWQIRQQKPLYGGRSLYRSLFCYIPRSAYNSLINAATYKAWQNRWDFEEVSQTKVWFPSLNPKASKILLSQPRTVFSRFVRFSTGHCFLRYQRALVAQGPTDPPLIPPINPPSTHPISPSSDSSAALTPPPATAPISPGSDSSLARVSHINPAILCRYCFRHLERAVDVITSCEFLWAVRLRAFGVFTLNATSPHWAPKNILRFLADPLVSGMEEDETAPQSP